ncbi:MAG: asparagine synthase (glutamine-hydrolyzing) [Alphaproteobacteria bacterium]
MCGIAGLMALEGNDPDSSAVQRMGDALAHRGPDGRGAYAAQDVAFAQTRLSIIDLETGDQPHDDGVGAALIANAEIYNFVELRARHAELEFATHSDCEVPLRLYPAAGVDVARDLRGMYALALHDRRENSLLLARDPFGIKPLYYVEGASGLAFASEPNALIAGGFANPRDLCQRALHELLSMQFTTGRDTVYRDIKRVLPGETILVRAGRVVERRNLSALPALAAPQLQSEDEALIRLDAALMDSVMVHQRSDVPYGMFLSGGIDSSALLAAMARLNETPVRAFTAGFSEGGAHDERDHARAVARAAGAEHVEIEFGETDFLTLLPRVAAALDDPVADYATLPTYKLGQKASEELKVVLCGEGGDELFAGYGRYRSATRPWWRGGAKAMRARSALQRFDLLREPALGWRDGVAAAEHLARGADLTPLQQVQAVDCAEWLPNDLLIKLDRCLMAHGVEGRTPFLDRAVAEVAFALPDALKVRRRLGKWLLRKWLAAELPEARAFEHKRGFTVPVGTWINRHGAKLGPLVANQPGVAELCPPERVRGIFTHSGKHQKFAAWILLFFALWHHIHVLGHAHDGDVFDCLAA